MSRRKTYVKARDLRPGMVVQYWSLAGYHERRVESIERAADAIERLRK